ncbi:hypothetical protein [Mesorhizobium sp.]|uniref:hypothetical protein n=1 Tax=Mesorhizobium sp. TaxID=1871066 RepID=UPI0012169CDF|nr:hypothetical protein [Mesorhizobium sp.]TIL32493.1 MAG: hypothetical protein E5Y85_16240 [Mesorhizobium sp.]TIL48932.1 MAG: hypothetical protein E5Y83_28870 [Mesorhizobium sp.]TIL97083.1 MAG: hypothetical protein E5Y68_00065 [Mesorhizobium sp.]
MASGNQFDRIFEEYVAEIESALPAVTEWFAQLKASRKYTAQGFKIDDVWPSLTGSHPVMIRIFREHFLRLAILIERLDREEEQEDEKEPSEDDWGTDDDDFEDGDEEEDYDEYGERPSEPHQVLIERLRAERPDLYAHFRQFMFIPIGLEDYLMVEREIENG